MTPWYSNRTSGSNGFTSIHISCSTSVAAGVIWSILGLREYFPETFIIGDFTSLQDLLSAHHSLAELGWPEKVSPYFRAAGLAIRSSVPHSPFFNFIE